MITGAGEDHDDDKEKVVGNENGAANGRENKEEAEILMSEEEILEELREQEKKLSQQNKELKQAYWNVRDFYKEQQQERALLEELNSRRLQNEMMNNNNSNILHRQLPWGLTFNPTDEDLMRYLRAKVDNIQLPFVDPILEFDVFTVDHPSQLFYLQRHKYLRNTACMLLRLVNAEGLMNETHVYFYVKKSGKVRSAAMNIWIAATVQINIFSSEGEMMGERRSLVYYNSKEKIPAKKTRWIMNEYRLPDPQPAIMSGSPSKDPFWTLCKIGETGRTSGDDDQVLPPPRPQPQAQQQPHQILQQVDNVELVPQEVTGGSFGGKDYQRGGAYRRIGSLLLPDQLDDNSTDDEEVGDDQDWIENLESTLEVDDEEQQPLQQLPLIHQQFDQQHQPWPQVLQQHTDDNIITVEDYDDIPPCIFLDEYQGNFDSWMETIKKRGHDDQQQQVYDEEEPSPKRAKARVAN
ncbi:hypothetical protein Scep_025418 [Stephania cephalantha]|uniref:NAC domain-containing protein n=1 Tax=Stephania cephalantha TaxID=152367 RepID=A0AAP0EIN4_9MAGN